MNREVFIPASIFDDPFFGETPYGNAEAFLWLSQVWDGKNVHMIADRLKWPKQNVWKFIQGAISHGLLDAVQFSGAELFYRKLARRSAIPSEVKRAVSRRDGNRCRYCGDTCGPFHFDHVKPWSKGGEHSTANLVVSCQLCNLKKADRSLSDLGWQL